MRTIVAIGGLQKADAKGKWEGATRGKWKGSGFLKGNPTVGTAKGLETADLAGMASVCGFGVGRPNYLRSGRCKRG